MISTKGISVRLSKFLQNQLHLKDGGHRHIAPIANVKMAKDDIAKDLRSIRAIDFFFGEFFFFAKNGNSQVGSPLWTGSINCVEISTLALIGRI